MFSRDMLQKKADSDTCVEQTAEIAKRLGGFYSDYYYNVIELGVEQYYELKGSEKVEEEGEESSLPTREREGTYP